MTVTWEPMLHELASQRMGRLLAFATMRAGPALDTRADPSEWIAVGGSDGGIPWYAPTTGNDLARAFYGLAAAGGSTQLTDAGVDSFDDYLAEHTMLATLRAEGYGWWVVIQHPGSIRQGC